MKLLDSTFIIDLIRGDSSTQKILKNNKNLVTTHINVFEIIRGFMLQNYAPEKLLIVSKTLEEVGVLPITDEAMIKAADISSSLIKQGQEISDNDCLVAGISLSHGIKTIITRNTSHFKRIKDISVESY
tara:strand:+ start:4079 stop:4465 length:387 start_codon:yes stop_codon:yes gene_type:complete